MDDKKMSLSVVFKNGQWKLLNENTVELILASQLEKEMFDDERVNTMQHLRPALQNFMFDIQITVNSTIQKTRVFTAEEKFQAMAEKNPVLNDMRTMFGLDLEY
ncbi:MAG: hypothetical protein ACK5UI_02905 [Bacteroidota bacterium]|jgi:DNA polymerase-3 subunit gamma/tau